MVSDEEVRRRCAFAFHELKLVVEPGGAVALAALMTGKIDVTGKIAVAVLSGGNVDADVFFKADCERRKRLSTEQRDGLVRRQCAQWREWVLVFAPAHSVAQLLVAGGNVSCSASAVDRDNEAAVDLCGASAGASFIAASLISISRSSVMAMAMDCAASSDRRRHCECPRLPVDLIAMVEVDTLFTEGPGHRLNPFGGIGR